MLAYMIFIMLIMHIIADYMLQTDLMAKAKQKKWWKENYPEKMYENDWMVILITHSFEWAFFIQAPLVVYDYLNYGYRESVLVFTIIALIVNTIMHAIVDNDKANKLAISLLLDQGFHILQIIMTLVTYWILFDSSIL